MSIKYITTMECSCEKCGHSWKTRTVEIPKVCSKCKRKDWNESDEVITDSEEYRKKFGIKPMSNMTDLVKPYESEAKKDDVPLSEKFQADEDFDDLINVDDSDVEELVVDENVDFGS
jgi:predicted  nucleic acid-binding Zn-ribbon protein